MSEHCTEGEAERFDRVGPLPARHWARWHGVLARAELTADGFVYEFRKAPKRSQSRSDRRAIDKQADRGV